MLSFECIKNEKSVYFLLTSAISLQILGVERHKHSIYPNGSAAGEVLPSHVFTISLPSTALERWGFIIIYSSTISR